MTLINIFTFTFNPLLVAIINYTYSINRKKRDSGFWTMWKNTSKQVHKLTDSRWNLLLELLLKLGNCSKTSHCYYLDTFLHLHVSWLKKKNVKGAVKMSLDIMHIIKCINANKQSYCIKIQLAAKLGNEL